MGASRLGSRVQNGGYYASGSQSQRAVVLGEHLFAGASAPQAFLSVLAAAFLASVSSFGGPAAVYRATGTGLASATLLRGLLCSAPFPGAGLLAHTIIAMRANRPLRFRG